MTIVRYLLVLLFPFAAAAAHAEIYACTGKAKVTVYQNFPCPLDTIGSQATAVAPPPEAASAAAEPAVPLPPTVPRTGMSKDAVRAIWGEPAQKETGSDEPGLGQRAERWLYSDSREVRFVDNSVYTIQK